MAESSPDEVAQTLEMIDSSPYVGYRHTALAGRVAAIIGVQLLVEIACDETEDLPDRQASESSPPKPVTYDLLSRQACEAWPSEPAVPYVLMYW